MDIWSGGKKTVVVIEGFKPDRATYLGGLFRSFFEHLNILVQHVNLEGLALSLMNPQYKGVVPSELQCREVFKHLVGMVAEEENFVFICDTHTEPFERREGYFSSEYSVETNSIFVVETSKVPEIRENLGIKTTEPHIVEITEKLSKVSVGTGLSQTLSSASAIKKRSLRLKSRYVERVSVLLSDLRKRMVLYRRLKLSQGIYLQSRYSTLYLLHTGYTIFFIQSSAILLLISKILTRSTLKKKWSIYFCTHHRVFSGEKRKDGGRMLKSELKFKRELKQFCEREKISLVLYAGGDLARETLSCITAIPKIEVSALSMSSEERERDMVESFLLLEGLDKTLVLSTPLAVKTLISHLKRKETEDAQKQAIPLHAVVKVTVKGTEVSEKRYFITRAE
ncbi:hypothetical protein NEDG_00335 [Nematocida displodere]|uniref:Uncharacterized protein n=1 Tax=Nematocida displodere TaxID=1805483 RepID=A0A177EKH3_9MICR|nr:hypothetical protein NEDG_00335 [Nematocida displodere]